MGGPGRVTPWHAPPCARASHSSTASAGVLLQRSLKRGQAGTQCGNPGRQAGRRVWPDACLGRIGRRVLPRQAAHGQRRVRHQPAQAAAAGATRTSRRAGCRRRSGCWLQRRLHGSAGVLCHPRPPPAFPRAATLPVNAQVRPSTGQQARVSHRAWDTARLWRPHRPRLTPRPAPGTRPAARCAPAAHGRGRTRPAQVGGGGRVGVHVRRASSGSAHTLPHSAIQVFCSSAEGGKPSRLPTTTASAAQRPPARLVDRQRDAPLGKHTVRLAQLRLWRQPAGGQVGGRVGPVRW